MRVILACAVLFALPCVATFAYKQYEASALEAQRQQALAVKLPQQQGEVLFFNAKWCGPCRQMKPIVAHLRREGYHLRDIDVDQHRNLAQKFGIRGIPTFVFVENGAEVKRFSGGTTAENLKQMCADPAYH